MISNGPISDTATTRVARKEAVITVIEFPTSPPKVNLVLTAASLLSGDLHECYSVDDEDCQAGVAAVSTFIRHLNPPHQLEPTLVFPKFEKQSQFVQVHPLGWNVNRLILQGLLQWKVLMSTPSLLLQNQRDNYGSKRDLTYLQNPQFPFLITNVDVPPSNSWAIDYHEYIHFDTDTHIALLSIANSGEPLNHDQIHSAWGALHTIADRNREINCLPPINQQQQALYNSYRQIYSQSNYPSQTCWIPVVQYDDGEPGNFQTFLQAILQHPHPPKLIIDVYDAASHLFPVPTLVTSNYTNSSFPSPSIWVHSFEIKDDFYVQHQLHLSTDFPQQLLNVTLIQQDMEVVPPEFKDQIYAQHIAFLRQQADQAIQNDPQVGYSTEFPLVRDDGDYRRCLGGECQIGNLFTDAIRWKAQADIAFVTSGGLRGEGWPAGPIHISHIWAALPFPNGLCQGVMTGISLFEMLNYAISIATFESMDTNAGARLLQVAGMQVEFNTHIPRESPRIVSIQIWNHDQKEWLPIEPLRLYKFATDSYLCGAYDPYPDFLGANGNFTLPGEVPGVVGDDLVQDVVAEYLQQLDGSYDAALQGRLVNNTNNFEVLNLVDTQGACEAKTFWSQRGGACLPCPDSSHVTFSDDRLEFQGQQSDGGIIPTGESRASSVFNATALNFTDRPQLGSVLEGRILLVNRELSNFSVVPKAIPSWLRFVDSEKGKISDRFVVGGPATILPSGSSLALDFVVGDENLRSGTALGTVSFGVLGRAVDGDEGIRACDDHSRDATFDVFLRVTPPTELNSVGNFRYIGISLMAIALATAIYFGSIIYRYRETAILKTMQPLFLVTVCIGIFIMALTILPLSLNGQALSERGADAACMASPWLLSMGMTVTFSALFSKLWRVNKLFNVRSFRRMKVTAVDVLMPFILLFAVNTALLISWNVVDPLRSVRLTVDEEEWKSYQACRSGHVGKALLYSVVAVNLIVLLSACWQAYQARSISSDFAESKAVGLAIGCWLQVLLVGIPALYLVDEEDVAASYFVQVGLLFVLCMSMLCIIFGPIIMMVFRYRKNPQAFMNRRRANRAGSIFVKGGNSQFGSGSYLGTSSHFEAFSSHGNPTASDSSKKRASRAFGVAELSLGDSSNGSSIFAASAYSKNDLKTIRKEWQDEEMGRADLGQIQERKPSLPRTDKIEQFKDDEASISASFSSESVEEVTEQMLLDDLVPREAMNSFRKLHESDSSTPFSGGSDFLQAKPMLGDDSSDDSSVPFQGKGNRTVLYESESDNDSSEDASRDDIDRPRTNNYSQHLVHSMSKATFTTAEHESVEALSLENAEDYQDEVLSVETVAIIATVENRKAVRMDEIPFSTRFADYKSRLYEPPLKNEDEIEVGHSSYLSNRSGGDGGKSPGTFTGMKDQTDSSYSSSTSHDSTQRNHLRIQAGRSDASHSSKGGNIHDVGVKRRDDPEEKRAMPVLADKARGKSMLGSSFTGEWQVGEKNSNDLTGIVSSLHHSFTSLNFTPSGVGQEDGENHLDRCEKKHSTFSTCHQSSDGMNLISSTNGRGGDSPSLQSSECRKASYEIIQVEAASDRRTEVIARIVDGVET